MGLQLWYFLTHTYCVGTTEKIHDIVYLLLLSGTKDCSYNCPIQVCVVCRTGICRVENLN